MPDNIVGSTPTATGPIDHNGNPAPAAEPAPVVDPAPAPAAAPQPEDVARMEKRVGDTTEYLGDLTAQKSEMDRQIELRRQEIAANAAQLKEINDRNTASNDRPMYQGGAVNTPEQPIDYLNSEAFLDGINSEDQAKRQAALSGLASNIAAETRKAVIDELHYAQYQKDYNNEFQGIAAELYSQDPELAKTFNNAVQMYENQGANVPLGAIRDEVLFGGVENQRALMMAGLEAARAAQAAAAPAGAPVAPVVAPIPGARPAPMIAPGAGSAGGHATAPMSAASEPVRGRAALNWNTRK